MKYNLRMGKLALAVTMAAALVGCDQGEYVDVNALDVEDAKAIRSQVAAVTEQEAAELKKALADLQAKDPTVKDVYYSVNEAGEKMLNVVKETADGATESSLFPFVAGMLLGNMIGNMNSMGGYSNYRNSYPPRSYSRHTKEEERRRKNVATSSYISHTKVTTTRTYKSSPSFQSKVSARSSRVFASSSSARSGGYSNGG